MEKVSREVAEAEITKWLDTKRVPPIKREEQAYNIEKMIGGVMSGDLMVNDDGTLTQTLVFPVEVAGKTVDTLTFKQRLTADEVYSKLKTYQATDADGRLRAYASAACDQDVKILGKLDSTCDYGLTSAIAVFFTP